MTSKVLLPRLRFADHINRVPWTEKPFEQLYDFGATNTFSRDQLNYKHGSIKNIHYGDIHTRFPALFDIRKEVVPFVNPDLLQNEERENALCREGDMIFADASEDAEGVGKCIEILNLSGQKLVSGTHTILAKRKGSDFIVGFAGYLFQSPSLRKRILKESQGAKVLGLSPRRLSSVQVCYPEDHGEQQKISQCFKSLDDLIKAEYEKLEALRKHKKGLLQQLFPRPERIENGETIPRLRFPEFQHTDEWSSKSLYELADGGFTNGIFNNMKEEPSSFKLINVQEMYLPRPIDETVLAFARAPELEIKKKLVSKNDIFFTRSSLVREGIAHSNIYLGSDDRVTFDGHVIRMRPLVSIVYPAFLHYSLKTDCVREQLIAKSKTATMTTIGQDDVAETMLPLPPTELEQKRLAYCFAFLDDLIACRTQKVELLKKHKRGLMQSLFPNPKGDHNC